MAFPDELQHLIRSDEPLGDHTWLGIGGPARFFAEPTDSDQLIRLIQSAAKAGFSTRILGGGSNLLIRETGFDGLVLSTAAANLGTLSVDDSRFTAGGGARLPHAISHAAAHGLSGLEHLAGIPGTVGGAIRCNAGGGGGDIGQAVSQLVVIGYDGEVATLARDQVRFSHRATDLEALVVLSATFQLERVEPVIVTKRMQKRWIVASRARPVGQRKIAMPFVDPDGGTAAGLIDSVGLANASRGGARFDSAYPGFLVVDATATSDDCLRLIDQTRDAVASQLGIDLRVNLQIW